MSRAVFHISKDGSAVEVAFEFKKNKQKKKSWKRYVPAQIHPGNKHYTYKPRQLEM